jgi:ABC-type antimicrobial peptide transport system permease subunit
MVSHRRDEIGVRIALGATRARVVGLILREAILLLALGLTIGLGFAAWAGRTAASLVYGMKPGDPLILGAAVALLALVALAASYALASRASRLQPMDALREE